MRATFVCEATVGHVAFLQRLQEAVAGRPEVQARWIALGPDAESALERVPPFSRIWTARASLRARRLLDASGDRPDVLFFHTVAPALLARRWLRSIPSVISLDATPVNVDEVGAAYGHSVGSRPMEAAKKALTASALRSARLVVAWSRWVERSLVADYDVDPARVVVQPPGVPVDRFQPPARRGGDGGVRFLFVGGDFARKGGPEVLRAFAEMAPGCRLDIVTGSGVGLPDTGATEAPAGRVHVHRGLTPDDPRLVGLYAAADVFVLPTRADTWGHAVVEAMASGLPVVTTAVGALPEIVADDREGLIVPPGDGRSLADAMRRLAAEPALRARLGQAGRSRAVSEFDARRNLARVVDLVVEAAGRQRVGS